MEHRRGARPPRVGTQPHTDSGDAYRHRPINCVRGTPEAIHATSHRRIADAEAREPGQHRRPGRFGIEHRLRNGATIRGGAAAAAAAAPDVTVTPLLPEQDRTYATIGGSLPLTRSLTVDGAYMRIFTPGRRGRLDERAPGQTAEQLNIGSYTLRANIVSLSLKASF